MNQIVPLKKVLTVGVFDLLHIAHVELFKHAKSYGEYLIVAVQKSEIVQNYKPEANLVYSTEERMYMAKSIKYVDEVIPYERVDDLVKTIDFDILVTGPDQNHQGFIEAIKWCQSHGKQTIVVPRTEGISTSWLKEQIKKM